MVDKITNPVKPLDVIDKINEVIDDYVTIGTAQNITGEKTFIGEKKIKFKQSSTADKLGIALYTSSSNELGALELRPNTINSKPILTLTSQNISTTYLGFRYWFNRVNILAPQPATGNYFITIGVTDGTNTIYNQTDTGVIDISTLLPTVPTNVSAFTNDVGYITNSALNGYATESYVTTAVSVKQDTLVSGTNIKTINNQSILGSGNIDIQVSGTVDSALSMTSENPVQNKVVSSALSELSANINIDAYLDMIIAGNTSDLPIIAQSTYSDDLDDIIGGTYDNNV